MRKYLFITVALMALGCGGGETRPLTAKEQLQRQECLLDAELASDRRADEECHSKGLGWDTCPSKQSIMDGLEDAQRDCSNDARN